MNADELKRDLGDDWEEIVVRLCQGGNTWKLSEEFGVPLSVLRHASRDRERLIMIVLKQYRSHLKLIRKVA